MKAEQFIELVQTMEPAEIERLFVLIKEYESEVRRRQASGRCSGDMNEFEKITDTVFSENKELFHKLAELERNEREASAKRPIIP
jgi:hypothetical protein